MDDNYVKISEEAFDELLRLLDNIIECLPAMPGHQRLHMYKQLDEIKELVYKEDN